MQSINNADYRVGIYCRLSKDDDTPGESMSIGTQKSILTDYCKDNGLSICDIYTDDGVSGLHFERAGFQRMLSDIESKKINMVITKDLSRLGRDYIMTGYYTEIFFPSKGVRYVAVSDGFDSNKMENDIAPFKNILNDMYARDISRKIKNAKHQRSKDGLFCSSQTPYGYKTDGKNKNVLIIDEEAASVVRLIFELALKGHGGVFIAEELKFRGICRPAVYKYRRGEARFAEYGNIAAEKSCDWSSKTVGMILNNRVYTGDLVAHKTEVTNYKTKTRKIIPVEEQILVENTHEAIVSKEVFFQVQEVRSGHYCPAMHTRDNLFRGILFCACCGHSLSIAHRKLTYREEDLYRCMHHYLNPEECPKPYSIYHSILCEFVLKQLRTLAKSLRRQKIQSPIVQYTTAKELTVEILREVVERIEIGCTSKAKNLSRKIHIRWKL